MENQKVLNFFSKKFLDLKNLQLQKLNNNDWIIEGSRSIEPSIYNYYSELKYEGYIIKKIKRTEYKQYIKNLLNEFEEDNNIDYNRNTDCFDNRFKYNGKLSINKLVEKIYNTDRFNFINDGFFITKQFVYIYDFKYSLFNSHIDEFSLLSNS